MALSSHFKVKRILSIGSKFTVEPFLGFTIGLIEYKNSSVQATGGGTTDSVVYRFDYYNNTLMGPIMGIETSFKIKPGVSLYGGFSYFVNNNNLSYTTETIEHYNNGVAASRKNSTYGGNGMYFQLGVRWHWRDLVKSGEYNITTTTINLHCFS